ncbi:putative f-box domain cyclin-like protein [Lasiodiplodia theobromae]|nr:putative f-box domain cyclin-like protein [Lasiodiplodia theobromae]
MSLEALPPELKMKIASHLQLRDLILLRSTSKRWQTVINNNLSFIRRARRDLLRLWDDTVRSPYFLPTRRLVSVNQYDFDRRQYLAKISCGLPLPEEFELWVLEWPAKAVIGWTWPGLEIEVVTDGYGGKDLILPEDQYWKLYGHNLLAAQPTRPRIPLYVWDKVTRGADGSSVWKGDRDAWLNMNGGLERLQRKVADHDVGVAIPVWSTGPTSVRREEGGLEERRIEYVLVMSGLGAAYNCSVQPFRKQPDPNAYGIYNVTHLDRDAVERGVWKDGPWIEGIMSAASWIAWLRRQLEVLESEHKRYGTMPVNVGDVGPL